MSDDMSRILRLLDLEEDGDAFVAPTPSDGPERLFGGQVASQSLRAATLTVGEDRLPHSLHAYFMRPGRPGTPLRLEVDRLRDGRSFTTRGVTASQDGEPIFSLTASFHIAEAGDDWQLPAPGAPDPESFEAPDSPFTRFASMSPFELRPVSKPAPGGFPIIHPFWVRTKGPLPDDPALHACVLAFISDMGVVGSARAPGSSLPARFMGASLDHALWFHRPARADDWLLFSVDPMSNAGSRGLARGTMHTRDGVLVASLAQEALLRDAGTAPLP
ncbi:MAG TPA: acyl-CoA thioesterase II [Acidimicrobiales bacterium]|nr:acyl-CoA thioesterase II [Acidimicrobiales bacterium]